MVTPRKGNSPRLGGHADPEVPSVSALGVLDLEALEFEGVRRLELSPVCVIAGFLFCGGQDIWWRVMS